MAWKQAASHSFARDDDSDRNNPDSNPSFTRAHRSGRDGVSGGVGSGDGSGDGSRRKKTRNDGSGSSSSSSGVADTYSHLVGHGDHDRQRQFQYLGVAPTPPTLGQRLGVNTSATPVLDAQSPHHQSGDRRSSVHVGTDQTLYPNVATVPSTIHLAPESGLSVLSPATDLSFERSPTPPTPVLRGSTIIQSAVSAAFSHTNNHQIWTQTMHAPPPSSLAGSTSFVATSSSPEGSKSGHQGGGAYRCPNCSKSFARDDLLRRHLAREARAQIQPSLDRQKSCYECARSKARCDLEVPACGRCRARGKSCVYGARSGNPNVRKSMRETQEAGMTPAHWAGSAGETSVWDGSLSMDSGVGAQGYHPFVKHEGSSNEEYESSDDSRAWSEPFSHQQQQQAGRPERSHSSSSSNTTGSFDYRTQLQQQEQLQHHQHALQGHASTHREVSAYDLQYGQPSFAVPPAPGNSSLSRGFLHSSARGGIDTSVIRMSPEDDEATPVHRDATGSSSMGPPLTTTSRAREGGATWPGPAPASAGQGMLSQRPQVPRLLTGARMPRPAEAGQASARPLFSAQLDLSGWLEEPVVPSPLYRMGPSLSALGSASAAAFAPPTPVAGSNGASQSLNAALMQSQQQQSSRSSNGLLDDTEMGGSNTTGRKEASQVAARNWWAASAAEKNDVEMQGVAQVCAGHFTLYPALMVLPDPTSPLPPLFHRPWLAQTRLQTPPSLAHVRVALAAYHVRLPASEPMIWEMIADQARSITASVDSMAHASDMDVFASTAALWFLIILLLMSSDPSTGVTFGGEVVDASLVGLSRLATLLHVRVRGMEQVQAERERQAAVAARDADSRNASIAATSFEHWGFEETARRTLFACYALFVLQRFRETSPQLQSQLADVELILDVKLPASASEFEAGSELEWRAAQHIKITDERGGEPRPDLTLRELLDTRRSLLSGSGPHIIPKERKETGNSDQGRSEERHKHILAYFDRHDDFTNVCLTTAFALDTRLV